MEIRGVDIVLGAQLLEMPGTTGLNLQEKFIIFYENGRKYKLYGINWPPSPNCLIKQDGENDKQRELKIFFYIVMLWKG